MFKFRSNLHYKTSIDLTPLVDVVFILLIFFILSYKEIDLRGHDIALPADKKGEVIKLVEKAPIVLTAYKNGRVFYQEEEVYIKDIPFRINEFSKKHGYIPEVIIDGDKDVPLQIVVNLFDAAKKGGIKKINLHTRKDNN